MDMIEATSSRLIPMWDDRAFAFERRNATRYAAIEEHLWMGWWAANGNFRVAAAVLQNISRTGAAVTVDGDPRPGDPVWLRLGFDDTVVSVQAYVVAVDPGEGVTSTVRMEFEGLCPNAFFGRVVDGV